MLHVIYLKLRIDQGQEWSSVTVSSLSKIILGVKNIVVEKVEIEECNQESQLIISARPHKRDMCRCSVCGQKSPRYDCGNGIRRWRAPNLGSGMKVYVEAEALAVPNTVLSSGNFRGCVTIQSSQKTLRIQPYGSRFICHAKRSPST